MCQAGLDPFEQAVPGCGGANVLAKIPGDDPRWIVVGAHFDHLGQEGKKTYWGADDNAAAVGVLVDVGRALARERNGRGVILAAFDGEEPPWFATGAMGSRAFVENPPVALSDIDLMVCMDLVGHRFGPDILPDEIGHSLFALGAERSTGTLPLVRFMKRSESGLIVRTADAEIIPPLSDHEPFWRAKIPFLFLSAGRSRVYHTPEDTPDKLDHAKIAATSRWLERFVRASRTRDERIEFDEHGSGDAVTLDELDEMTEALSSISTEAQFARRRVQHLRLSCDRTGRLPEALRPELAIVVAGLESRLA
jgi:Zn-dependent M28 family amino/carboxypeptidase